MAAKTYRRAPVSVRTSEGGMWRDAVFVVAGTCGAGVSGLIGESCRAGVFLVSDRQSYKSDLSDERWA
jgi:hypothetical protein